LRTQVVCPPKGESNAGRPNKRRKGDYKNEALRSDSMEMNPESKTSQQRVYKKHSPLVF
jgi:hypothetical protein